MRLVFLFLVLLASPALGQSSMTGPTAGSVPVPDPTLLTTRQLDTAIANLKEQIKTADDALRDNIEIRLDAMDLAIKLRNEWTAEIRGGIAEDFANDRQWVTERFARVDAGFANVKGQFEDRDKTVADALAATQKTANDALAATEKAIATAAGVTKDLITSQGGLFTEKTNSIDVSMIDLKRRADVLEGRTAGLGEARGMFNDNGSLILSGVGVAIALAALFAKGRPQEAQVRYVHVPPQQGGVVTTTNTQPS